MKDVPQRHRRIYITRQHLISLGFTTLGIAVLTFALGYKVGYSRDISAEDSESILLLPDIQEQQTLESLLRQIERTKKTRELGLQFSQTKMVVRLQYAFKIFKINLLNWSIQKRK